MQTNTYTTSNTSTSSNTPPTTNYRWISLSVLRDYPHLSNDSLMALIGFWERFYFDILNSNCSDDFIWKTSQSCHYKNDVLTILENGKRLNSPLTDDDLYQLQVDLEDHTMHFNEKSIYKSSKNILKILIKSDGLNAKEFLIQKCKTDNYESDIKELVSVFGQYTIEALIVNFRMYDFTCVSEFSTFNISSSMSNTVIS